MFFLTGESNVSIFRILVSQDDQVNETKEICHRHIF